MYQGLLHLHNLLRWLILLLAVIAIVKAYTGMNTRKPFSNGEKKVGLFLMISTHLTFLIGLYLWIVGALRIKNIRNLGMGDVMKNSIYRYWAVEHFIGMLIAIILITIGRATSRSNITDRAKHKKTFWYYLIALIIILLTIPWPFRQGIGRPLLPGM